MNRIQTITGSALVLMLAGAATAGSGSVLGVAGHTAYAQIIIQDTSSGGGPEAIEGLIACPSGDWMDRLDRWLRDIPACAASGYVYAYPAWAGEPWTASDIEVLGSSAQIDGQGRLWNTVSLRYTPQGVADHPDGMAVVEAFAVELVPPTGDGADATNYHLTLDAEALAIHPGGLASLTIGVGPDPVGRA